MDGWIHVDRKGVAHTANLNVLVKRVVFAILGQQAKVTFAVRNLVFAGSVIGHIGVADVLNVPNHAVKNVGHFHVGVVVHRDDLGAGSVLALVVGDLSDVLRQLVNRQTRAGVDRLPLHRATGGQHIGGPLPVVVGRAGVKAQIVDLIFAALGKRGHRQIKPGTGCGQDVRRAFLWFTAFGHCASSRNACEVCHYLILLRTLFTVALTLLPDGIVAWQLAVGE